MYHQILDLLRSDNGMWVLIGLFTALVLGGFGAPIPEDIPLIFAGAAAAKGVIGLKVGFLTCYCGVLVADQVVYLFGFFFGQKLLNAGTRSSWFPAITEERVDQVREGLRRKRLIYIFIGRHIFPVRTLTFLTAGALRVPFLEFLLADAIAALVSTSLMIGVGYLLGATLTPETIEALSKEVNLFIGALVVICALAYLAYKVSRRQRQV